MKENTTRHNPCDLFAVPQLCLEKSSWSRQGHDYRKIEEHDIELIRQWRNAQQSVLRQQTPITDVRQREWWEHQVQPSYQSPNPDMFLVVSARDGLQTSYGGLTNIEWVSGRAEISFLASDEISLDSTAYQLELCGFLAWLFEFAFHEIGLRRLFTETWADRRFHIEILERNGLVPEGRLREHVVKDGVVLDALVHGILRTEWSDDDA